MEGGQRAAQIGEVCVAVEVKFACAGPSKRIPSRLADPWIKAWFESLTFIEAPDAELLHAQAREAAPCSRAKGQESAVAGKGRVPQEKSFAEARKVFAAPVAGRLSGPTAEIPHLREERKP